MSESQTALSVLSCPLCAAPDPVTYHEDAGGSYLRCSHCALVFLRPDLRPTPLREVLRYQEHENTDGDEGYARFLHRLIDPLLARLPSGARGLDYGCGPAPVLGEILTSHGFPTVSYDPLFLPEASVLEHLYDFVTCSEVMEHVHDPRAALDTFASLLQKGGTLAIMTRFYGVEVPFAQWWYRRDATHVCFYCEETMRWIASNRGWCMECPTPHVALFAIDPQ